VIILLNGAAQQVADEILARVGREMRLSYVTIVIMRQPLRAAFLFMASVLMAFAAVVNAIVAVPHLREDMLEIHVRPTLLGAISMGLYFGTFAMFGLALVVLVAAVQHWRGTPAAAPLLAIIAAIYIAFGVCAFFIWSGSVHVLAYALMGVLIVIALFLPASKESV
jgi:drug/metabolite transporter (DMT)-like permease